jgi:hypothetical protein
MTNFLCRIVFKFNQFPEMVNSFKSIFYTNSVFNTSKENIYVLTFLVDC